MARGITEVARLSCSAERQGAGKEGELKCLLEMMTAVIFILVLLIHMCAYCIVAQSCPTPCDPMDYSFPGSSVHGDSPGKNTGVGCRALLQGIFPTQESNTDLPHYRWVLYHLSHQGSPRTLE